MPDRNSPSGHVDLTEIERHHREIRTGAKRWGLWAYDPHAHQLVLTRPGGPHDYGEEYDYWTNVSECHSEAGRLAWIAQIAEKNWSSQIVGDFVRAMNDIVPLRASTPRWQSGREQPRQALA